MYFYMFIILKGETPLDLRSRRAPAIYGIQGFASSFCAGLCCMLFCAWGSIVMACQCRLACQLLAWNRAQTWA